MADSEMYIVENGEYSDYQVHFVTADKKLADDFCLRANGGKPYNDGYRVDTIPVYDSPPDWWEEVRVETSLTPGHPPARQRDYTWQEFGRKKRSNAAQTTVHNNQRGTIFVRTVGWDRDRIEKSHAERVAFEYAKQQGVA